MARIMHGSSKSLSSPQDIPPNARDGAITGSFPCIRFEWGECVGPMVAFTILAIRTDLSSTYALSKNLASAFPHLIVIIPSVMAA